MAEEPVVLTLRRSGRAHLIKFYPRTPREELLAFVREELCLPEAFFPHIRFLDRSGCVVLLNDRVPSGTVFDVVAGAPEASTTSEAWDCCHDIESVQTLLRELKSVEDLLKSAAEKRRKLQDMLGPAQTARSVFREEMPIYIRQLIFEHLSVSETVKLSNISRGFLAWCSSEGRRVIPVIDDRALQGGQPGAKRLARLVHPSFIQSLVIKEKGEAACSFLEAVLSQGEVEFGCLRRVEVANTRFAPATILIRLLQRAGRLQEVSLLTRLDRPLPSQCLRSVKKVHSLVLHSTQVLGFPSLFTGGAAAALSFVQILDSPHLNFHMLLGSFTAPCAPGLHVRHLQVAPRGDEPLDRHWAVWMEGLAELLQCPALAALQELEVPVPSSAAASRECAAALLARLRAVQLPANMARLRFLPYEKDCCAFAPNGAPAAVPGGDLVGEIQELLRSYQTACPHLTVHFPGVRAPPEDAD